MGGLLRVVRGAAIMVSLFYLVKVEGDHNGLPLYLGYLWASCLYIYGEATGRIPPGGMPLGFALGRHCRHIPRRLVSCSRS